MTVHDLSLTGALIETSMPMLVGAIFEVELATCRQGRGDGRLEQRRVYGCQFELPISPSVLSAALLQAAPRPAQNPELNSDPLNELQELNAEVEQLAWKMENALKRLTHK